MAKNIIVTPSILAADFANIQRDVEMLNESEADWIHIDIMDGRFVPNISFGFPVLEAIQKHAKKPLDVHLMIVEPEKYLEKFKNAGAYIISVHLEACTHLHRTIHQIKELGCKAGVALNPHTPISLLQDIIQDVDLICLMSVNPGFGGQKFIHQTYEKIKALEALVEEKSADVIIEIDGGVNDKNAKLLVDTGATALVAGSFVFKSENPQANISGLKNIMA